MALTKCGECGNQISDEAKSCPHCGFIAKTGRRVTPWLAATLIAVGAGVGVFYMSSDSGVSSGSGDLLSLDNTASIERLTNEETIALRQMVRRSSVRVFASYGNGRGGTGSGFVLRRIGDFVVVLTNAHVVTDSGRVAATVQVKPAGDEALLDAYTIKFLQDGQSLDYAFLVVRDANASLGQEVRLAADVREGDYVLAVGSPLGEEFLIDDGNVLEVSPSPTGRFVVHSALIERGSSGGGLFNSRGELVGVNTFLSSDGETGIAIVSSELAARAYHVRVDAAADWQDTGILIGPQTKAVSVIALGTWRIGFLAGLVPPAGVDGVSNPRSISNNAAHGALLVRVGRDGDVTGVDRWRPDVPSIDAALRELTPPSTQATIQFRVNDLGQEDNSGFLDVVILASE